MKRKVLIVKESKGKAVLFKKTDTILVYLASIEYTKELLKSRYKLGDRVYIHVKRDTGFALAYNNNDLNDIIQMDIKDENYILELCDSIR